MVLALVNCYGLLETLHNLVDRVRQGLDSVIDYVLCNLLINCTSTTALNIFVPDLSSSTCFYHMSVIHHLQITRKLLCLGIQIFECGAYRRHGASLASSLFHSYYRSTLALSSFVDSTRTSMSLTSNAEEYQRPEIGEASGSTSRTPILHGDWSDGRATSPATSQSSAGRADLAGPDPYPVSNLRCV